MAPTIDDKSIPVFCQDCKHARPYRGWYWLMLLPPAWFFIRVFLREQWYQARCAATPIWKDRKNDAPSGAEHVHRTFAKEYGQHLDHYMKCTSARVGSPRPDNCGEAGGLFRPKKPVDGRCMALIHNRDWVELPNHTMATIVMLGPEFVTDLGDRCWGIRLNADIMQILMDYWSAANEPPPDFEGK